MSRNIQQRIAANTARARALVAELQAGLQTRLAADTAAKEGVLNSKGQPMQPSPEWARCIAECTGEHEAAMVRQIAALGRGFDFANFVKVLPNTQQGQNYIQAKTVEKVFKFVNAVFTQDSASATDYSVQVIYNALKNGGELKNADVWASLSRKVLPTDPGKIHSQGDYRPGTAGAQGSQIRMLAHVLKFADVQKSKRDDTMRIKPELMQDLRELFGVTDDNEGVTYQGEAG